jgi:ribose transport system substrate-binding protein
MLFTLCACFSLMLAGCGDKSASSSGNSAGLKRIIFLNNTNSPFWDACRAGIKKAEQELKLADVGLSADMDVNNGKPEGQIAKLRQYQTEPDIVAVAISPMVASNAAVAEELRKLRKKGVHVICVDNDVDREKFRDCREFYLGTDNIKGGRELGICAKELQPDGGKYVQFVGDLGAQNAMERMQGFSEAVGQKFTEVDRMADAAKRDKARENVRNAIRNNPDLAVLVGIWSYNAPAIVDVVKELEKPDIKVVTFDAEELAIDAMEEGHIDAMVVQNPFQMGYQLVRVSKALLEKDDATIKELFPRRGETDGDLYETGLKVVVPNADSPLKKEMFNEKTEFLTLDKFKQWLEEYNLTSS